MQKPRRVIGFIIDEQKGGQPLETTTVQVFALLLEAQKPSKTLRTSVDVWMEGLPPGELPQQAGYTPHFALRGALEDAIKSAQMQTKRAPFPEHSFAYLAVGSRAFCAAQVHLWSLQHDLYPNWALHLLRRLGTVPEGYCGWISLDTLQVCSHPIASLVHQARAKARST